MVLSLLQPSITDVWDLSLLERLSNVIDNWTPEEFQGLLDEEDMVFSLLKSSRDGSPQGYYALLLPDGEETLHTTLMSFTIHPAHRRQGLGRALFATIPPSYFPLVAGVRESDTIAQLFLRSMGFTLTPLPRSFDCPPEKGFTFIHKGNHAPI